MRLYFTPGSTGQGRGATSGRKESMLQIFSSWRSRIMKSDLKKPKPHAISPCRVTNMPRMGFSFLLSFSPSFCSLMTGVVRMHRRVRRP